MIVWLETLPNILLLAAAIVGLVDPVPAGPWAKAALGLGLVAGLCGSARARAGLAFAVLGASLETILRLPSACLAWPSGLLGFWLAGRPPSPATPCPPPAPTPLAIVLGVLLGAACLLGGPYLPLALISAGLAAAALSCLFRRSRLIQMAALVGLGLLVQIARNQYRPPGQLFFAYERSEPTLLGFFSRTLRGDTAPDHEAIEYLQAGPDHFFMADAKSWLSDGGTRVVTAAAAMAVFASEWLGEAAPLTLLSLSTPELCEALRHAAPRVEFYQAAPFLNGPGCARYPSDDALANARHLMIYPSHEHYTRSHPLPDFAAPGRSLWKCDSDEMPEAMARRYATLAEGFRGRPGPYYLQVGTSYCLITAGPDFFADRRVLDNPVIHRVLAFSDDRRREVTAP